MSSSSRDPDYLYLLAVGDGNKEHILWRSNPSNFNGPQALHAAMLPSYKAAFKSFPGDTILAVLDSKDLSFDLSSKGLSLIDVCHAAYASSTSDDDSDGELDSDEHDDNCVCVAIMVGNKTQTVSKADPSQFGGPEALHAEVLSLCESGYSKYGDLTVSLMKISKMFLYANDEESKEKVKNICNLAYPYQ